MGVCLGDLVDIYYTIIFPSLMVGVLRVRVSVCLHVRPCVCTLCMS